MRAISLSDRQLTAVMTAARALEPEKRDLFLQRTAAVLTLRGQCVAGVVAGSCCLKSALRNALLRECALFSRRVTKPTLRLCPCVSSQSTVALEQPLRHVSGVSAALDNQQRARTDLD